MLVFKYTAHRDVLAARVIIYLNIRTYLLDLLHYRGPKLPSKSKILFILMLFLKINGISYFTHTEIIMEHKFTEFYTYAMKDARRASHIQLSDIVAIISYMWY